MKGFPPPPEARVNVLNWQQNPQKIWSFQHVRELFPTRRIQPKSPGASWQGAQKFEHLKFKQGAQSVTWPEFLQRNHVDAALILHQGKVVDERYFNGMDKGVPHFMFSASKSMTGLMAATAVAEGRLDETAQVGKLIPELVGSAWADATVRQVMDMTDGVRFSEDYYDPSADVWAYSAAMGWVTSETRNVRQVGILEMLPTLRARYDEPQGKVFHYRSAATDVVAWLAKRAYGMTVSEWLESRLWAPLGMEYDASMMLDPAGTEVAFAGISATARDLARIGQMLLDGGRVNGYQILPSSIPADLAKGGDQAAFEAGAPGAKGRSYRNQWWVSHQSPRSFSAIGAFNQRLMVFPDDGLVVVLFSSHPRPTAAPELELPLHNAVLAMVQQLQGR